VNNTHITLQAERTLREHITRLAEISEEIKLLEKKASIIKDEIKEAAQLNGEPRKVLIQDGNGRILCTAATEETVSIDTKRLRDEKPEVAAKYEKVSYRQVVRLA